jgi:hypothetical protein
MGRPEVYTIGEKVERRDAGEEWRIGYVTSVSPFLKVTLRHFPKDTGYVWDEVRKIKKGNEAKTFQKAPSKSSTGRSSSTGLQSNVTTTLEVSQSVGDLEHHIRRWTLVSTPASLELQQEDAEDAFTKAKVESAPIGFRKRDKVMVFVMRSFCCIW